MPTEREHSRYNDLGHDTSKYKQSDPPHRRLMWLDGAVPTHDNHIAIRVIVILLAVYGLYSLIF